METKKEDHTVKGCSLIAAMTKAIPSCCTGGECQEQQKPLRTSGNILIMKVTGDTTFPFCIQLEEVTKRQFRRDVDMKDRIIISS